jgi:hypothetical protein
MMENPVSILDKFILYILELLDTPLMYLKPIDILLMAAFMVGTYYFVKVLLKAFMRYGYSGVKIVYRPFIVLYGKNKHHRENKRTCHVCKNSLHKCTCPSNRGVSYKERLAKWKKVESANKLARKQAELKKKEQSRPVELKRKKNGGR